MHRRHKSIALSNGSLHDQRSYGICIKGKAAGSVGVQRQTLVKQKILRSLAKRRTPKTNSNICKCTVTGICKCRIEILLPVNRIVITVDCVILQGDTSLTEIIVSLKSSLFAEIVKCSHNLEGGTWRICTICGSVQKTAVILVVYQIVPIIPNGIGIKIRLAHFYKPFSGRWFHYHNSPSSVTQCIVCNALKIGIQGRYNRISGILLIKELILHLSQKKGMGSQKGKVRL